ncbi:TAXI family TRAP transporter solute-binding subunit [Myxococcaceae bacterium GXIMD 01537]
MKTDTLHEQLKRTSRRDLLLTLLPALLVVGLAFALTYRFVEPAPPRTVVLALAPDEGGFRYYARKYQEFLARHGVTLELRTTKGSATNVELLADERAGVDVAFVESGTVNGDKAGNVLSLGSLSYVPLWVFYRGEPVEDLRGLKGRRIAVGPVDSGTHTLATTLLKANGVDEAPTELVPLERDAAIEQLKQGQVDAIFLISPAESPAIARLAAVPGVRLLSFARADAYVRRYPYLSKLVLPRGELQLDESPDRPMLEDMLKRLEEAERAVNSIPTPLAYAENLYVFREHIDIVRRRLLRRLTGAGEHPETSAPQQAG